MTKEKIELLQLRNFDDQSHESNNKTNEFNELNDFCFFLPFHGIFFYFNFSKKKFPFSLFKNPRDRIRTSINVLGDAYGAGMFIFVLFYYYSRIQNSIFIRNVLFLVTKKKCHH